ncbi:hypothetical protein N177_4046 [Lutibaculum baratangense AMV1]|uniref:HTH marR-type domain-containing protein n=1 Tax=Lutibaculum baratangense AMV1 TaxID=631454 RepID=V4RC21_9HYPH|nr:hypothetical protein N177_4046 [Lutibaculum baratangense AMV1]
MLLADHVSQALSSIYGERFGISNPEWRVLALLGELGALTSTEIVRRGRMHKTKVSRTVSELESRGLVSRRVSQVDMRVAHLSLTTQGRALYERIVPLAAEFAEGLADGVGEDDMEALERALEAITEQAEKLAERLSRNDG